MMFFLVFDVIFVALAMKAAFLIRFDGIIPEQYLQASDRLTLLAIVFTIPLFYLENLYHFSWSYVGTSELMRLLMATSVSFFLQGVTIYISNYFPLFQNFPRSVLIISYLLVIILSGGLRFSKRLYSNFLKGNFQKGGRNLLIAGAGDAAEQLVRSLLNSKNAKYRLIGFVDDSQLKSGIQIHGIKVLGKIKDIPEIISRHSVEELIIAIPSASPAFIKEVVGLGRKAGLGRIRRLPPVGDLIKGKVSWKDIKQVDVADLLGRANVVANEKLISKFIWGKKILITGAAGSIGSELCRQTAKFNPEEILVLDQDETGIFEIENELAKNYKDLKIIPRIADICDERAIKKIFTDFHPDVVFHAAAYKHVPLMEQHPLEAIRNNIFGTNILAEAAVQSLTKNFVFISTDKAVNPTSVMGSTKRVGEMITTYLNAKQKTKFVSVRFGNVLDSRGSVIPIFKRQLASGEPLTVTHPEMKRYFMLTSEAVLLVLEAAAIGQGGEVFVLDMGQPVKIWDLAKEMIRLSGYEPDKDVEIIFTGPRPGEKMFEEMLTSEEGTSATQSNKVFKAKISPLKEELLKEYLLKMKNYLADSNETEAVNLLKSLVAFHQKPQN